MSGINKLGEPITCKPEERPLYPVRFSLKRSEIDKVFNRKKDEDNPVIPPATGIDDNKYELRRLRQGYLYILAQLGHHDRCADEHAETPKRLWRIFKYDVQANGSVDEDNTNYLFRECIWKDGTADGQWNEETPRPYPTVHPEVSIIEYLYSEEKLPSRLLETLEVNPTARQRVMQKVNLCTGDAKQTLPFSQLTEKVADFNQANLSQDKKDSERRYVSLGYSKRHLATISNSCTKKNALIIAVHDPLGNAKDFDAYHQLTWVSEVIDKSQHVYPLTTARAVKQIETSFSQSAEAQKQWADEKPLHTGKEWSENYQKYSGADPFGHQLQMHNLAAGHKAILDQTGNYTIQEMLALLKTLAPSSDTNYHKEVAQQLKQLNDYSLNLYAESMSNMGVSPAGIAVQSDLLALGTTFGDYLSFALGFSSKVEALLQQVHTISLASRLPLEMSIDRVAGAQLYRIEKGIGKTISLDDFLKPFGLKTAIPSKTGSYDLLAKHLKQQMKDLADGSKKMFGLISKAIYEAEAKAEVVHPKHQLTFKATLAVSDDTLVKSTQARLSVPVGKFFAAAIVLVNLKEWKKEPEHPLQSPLLRLVTDCLALVGSFDQTPAAELAKNSKNHLMKKITALLDKNQLKNTKSLAGKADILAWEKTPVGHQIKATKVLTWVARSANVLGIVIAGAQAWQGHKTNDTAMVVSGVSAVLAEVCFLGATFMASGVLTAVGVVFVLISIVAMFFIDPPLIAWVKKGFWGKNEDYWGAKRQEIFSDQLDTALALNDLNDPSHQKITECFEKEMREYYNLIWRIRLEVSAADDRLIRLYLPAFKQEKDRLRRLKIEMHEHVLSPRARAYGYGYGGYGYHGVNLSDHDIDKQWNPAQNCVEIRIDKVKVAKKYQYIFLKNHKQYETLENRAHLKITAKYPHLGEDIDGLFGWFFVDYFENSVYYAKK